MDGIRRASPRGPEPLPSAGDKIVIGWSEYVDLPGWGVRRLLAKVDTGARNSALHVENVEELPGARVAFDVILHRRRRDRRVRVETRVLRRGRVRSSTGEYSVRIFVGVRVRLGGIEQRIELSLVNRGDLLHRMLLGRSAIGAHFLVDPGHRVLLGRPARRRRRRPDGGARKSPRRSAPRRTPT